MGSPQMPLPDCFITGLKSEICRDVIAQDPTSMIRAVSLAKLYEEKHVPKQKTYPSQISSKPATTTLNQTHKTTGFPPLLPTTTNITSSQSRTKNYNVRNMSTAKMQLRREKGLCFTYDDKFTALLRFPNKKYLLLHTKEEEAHVEEPDPLIETGTCIQNVPLDHHQFFHALKGGSGVVTINGMAVQIFLKG